MNRFASANCRAGLNMPLTARQLAILQGILGPASSAVLSGPDDASGANPSEVQGIFHLLGVISRSFVGYTPQGIARFIDQVPHVVHTLGGEVLRLQDRIDELEEQLTSRTSPPEMSQDNAHRLVLHMLRDMRNVNHSQNTRRVSMAEHNYRRQWFPLLQCGNVETL